MPCRSKDLVTLWNDLIWSDTRMRAFTTQFHPQDETGKQDATCDLAKVMYCGKVNFGQYFIQRFRSDDQVGCCGSYQYRVRVEYYLEDTCDNHQVQIQDFFEALDEIIEEKLGLTWQDNVLQFSRDTAFPNIRRYGLIDGRVVYYGTYSYFAEADSC